MMGNVIEGGVIGTTQEAFLQGRPSTISFPQSSTTILTSETPMESEASFCDSTETFNGLTKTQRSKSFESLTHSTQPDSDKSSAHPEPKKKSNSISSEILDKLVDHPRTFKDFLNIFRPNVLPIPSDKLSGEQPGKEDTSLKTELEISSEKSSPAEEVKTLNSELSTRPSDSTDSYHTVNESTVENNSEDMKANTISRNSSVFDFPPDIENEISEINPAIQTENIALRSVVQQRSDLILNEELKNCPKNINRQLLGRAFSCEGPGIRNITSNMNEESDETESEKGQSDVQINVTASSNNLSVAESDEEEEKTLVIDEDVTTDARDNDDIDGRCDDNILPDNDIHVAYFFNHQSLSLDEVQIRLNHSNTDNDLSNKNGIMNEAFLCQDITSNTMKPESVSSKTSQDDEEMSDKAFEVDALNIDPSSAASEQVLENLVSSSSQPSFDDPDSTEEKQDKTSNIFVFPDGKTPCDLEEKDLNGEMDEDFIEKMPMSPLVRNGSRIIDKKTKTVRSRPRSYHSSGLQSEIKEEIFTEMGFSQEQHCRESNEELSPVGLVLTPKSRVPFKSIQVQSLMEIDEEECEGTLEKNRTHSIRGMGCRPKSFHSSDFHEGTEEVVKKIPDPLDKSFESEYASSSHSQSSPSRPLAATPSLTMPSALTQPKPTSQDFADNTFESCRNENTKKIDEHAHLVKFKAVLRRDPQGYGIRTGGNKPVTILSVVEGSVAARHGLKARDVIFMLNGTNVSQYDHESVSSFFKASRTHMEIVVLRQVDGKIDPMKYVSNQIGYLKNYPALMACFLLDLTLHNKQNSLFFSMAAYVLRQKDACDSNFQRWAYEIFSTFLDQHAPLKLQHGLEVPSISGLLCSDETSIRQSYESLDGFLQPTIKKQLNDYLKNNGLVHEFELKNMEHLKQMKHIEKVLWKSFETLSSEEKDDKKQALAASMATFFHLIGFSSIRGGNLLESFPSFVSVKMPVKMKKSKGHLFRTDYLTSMSPCGVCKQPTWNLGTTVYKCSSCSFYIHSYCLFKLTEACNFKRKTNSFATFYGVDDPNSSFDLSKSYAGLFRSRSCQLSSKTAFIGDPDLDIPLDLPHLKDVIPHEELKRLKNKELKFQEIVNELFHTEKLHVRSLKIMKMLYERPMRAEPTISNITNLLFPNLDELIRVHDQLNVAFEKCKEEQCVVTRIGDILVSMFSGTRGDQLKKASAIFCKDQSYSLFTLRKNLRKEKLTQIIQDAALNPYSGRLSLKDFLPKEMQRITKYPLLIDSLINNMPATSDEYPKLVEASKLSRNILRYVDCQVRDSENGRKLMDLQMRLDARQLENSTDPNVIPYRKLNLTKKKLIMDGELVWKYKRAGGSKTQDLHVVLCEDILLLLVKQEGRLVLRCHTTTIEDQVYVYYPVLRLSGLLTKDAGRDKCAFYIVDRNSPQVYHLAAKNKDLRNRWFKIITETVNNLPHSAPTGTSITPTHSTLTSSSSSSSSTNQKDNGKREENTAVKNSTDVATKGVNDVNSDLCTRRDSAPSLLGSFKRKLPMVPSKSLDVGSTTEDERRIARPLHLPLPLLRPSSLSLLPLSSLSSPPPIIRSDDDDDDDDNDAFVLDDLKRNILMVNSLLREKISMVMDGGVGDGDNHPLQQPQYHPLSNHHNHHHNHRRHHLWRPLSLCDDYNCGGGRNSVLSYPSSSSSTSSSSSSPWINDGEVGNDYSNQGDDNARLISKLSVMSEKEVVLFCLPQVEAIKRLVDDSHDSHRNNNNIIENIINNSIISNNINNNNLVRNNDSIVNNNSNNAGDSRHLQQLRHWKLQSLRLQSLDRDATLNASYRGRHLSRDSFNINNNNNTINSPTSPISPSLQELPSLRNSRGDVFARRDQFETMGKLVSLTTRIELALSQLMMNRHKKESDTAESLDLPISL